MAAPRQVIASAAVTVTGNSGVLQAGGASPFNPTYKLLNLLVDVTAVGGDADETLDLAVEYSHDGGVTFAAPETAHTFTQLTQPQGAQTVVKQFNMNGPHYRIVWTLAGTTPSFTFAVDEWVV